MRRKLYIINILFWCVFSCALAQITIGSGLEPIKGTLLDLKDGSNDGKTSTKGLMLPRVRLQEIYSLQMGETAPKLEGLELAHAGLMVYNVNDSYPICRSLYIWNGSEWITPTPCNIPAQGFGILSGKMCYDVLEGGTDIACGEVDKRKDQKVDFSDRTVQDPKTGIGIPIPGGGARYSGVQVYTFTASEPVNSISFFYENPSGIDVIKKIEWDKEKGAGNFAKGDEMKVTVYFNKDLNSIAKGHSRTNPIKPKIAAVFKTNSDNEKYMQEITPSIQDCACCGAKSTLNGGWMEFMCHDLGVDENSDPLKYDPTQSPYYVSHYEWGRPSDGHEIVGAERVGVIAPNMDAVLNDPKFKGKFIQCKRGAGQDWVLDAPPNRWTKTYSPNYDPCPIGWHVPSIKDWESILGPLPVSANIYIPTEGVMLNGNMVTYKDSEGIRIGDLLYLPPTGYSDFYGNRGIPERTQLWVSEEWMNIIITPYPDKARITYFKQATSCYAHAVRCVADY